VESLKVNETKKVILTSKTALKITGLKPSSSGKTEPQAFVTEPWRPVQHST